MKRILKDFFIEIFKNGFLGFLLGIMMWIISITISALILYGSYWALDSIWLSSKIDRGIIIDKEFTAQHIYLQPVMVGKVSVLQPRTIEDNWGFKIKIGKVSDDISVDKQYYNNKCIGDTILVRYSIGRLSKEIYIKEIPEYK